MNPRFFSTPTDFRSWLESHHDEEKELLVGFYKKGSGKPSITWPESVDQALCFGWIDGVRRRIDDERYSIRFTPRRKGSNWSAINIGRVQELIEQGLMHPAGLEAFERRTEDGSRVYSYEKQEAVLDPDFETRFRSNKGAWTFFSEQAPSYRRVAIYWVMSAKRPETRERRLATLIDDSAHKRRLAQYTLEKRSRS